jgi:hypothetical protein
MLDRERNRHILDRERNRHILDRERNPHILNRERNPQVLDRERNWHILDSDQNPHIWTENFLCPEPLGSSRPIRELGYIKDQAPTPKAFFQSAGSVAVIRLASEPDNKIDSG